MLFSSLIGNESVKQQLIKTLQKQALPNAVLFSGPEGVGKSFFAKEVAKYLLEEDFLSEHPDFHLYGPESKSFFYKIETIREILEEAYKPPFSAPRKVFILQQADKMQPVSSNALLKTLEEPTLDAFFILITSCFSQILPTIVSRTAHFSFLSLKEEEIEKALIDLYQISSLEAKKAAKISQGSFTRACELVSSEKALFIKEGFFALFQKKFQSLEEFFALLTRIEKYIMEAKEPVRALRQFFSYIYLWYKDVFLLQEGLSLENLYFSELRKEKRIEKALPPIDQVETWIEKALVLFERGTKAFSCLEYISIQFRLV